MQLPSPHYYLAGVIILPLLGNENEDLFKIADEEEILLSKNFNGEKKLNI